MRTVIFIGLLFIGYSIGGNIAISGDGASLFAVIIIFSMMMDIIDFFRNKKST
jgi:hypothetical protein